jgi:hypothetical protein
MSRSAGLMTWLQRDVVYGRTLNSALLLAFLAAIGAGKWPQFSWAFGAFTFVMAALAFAIYLLTPSSAAAKHYDGETKEIAATGKLQNKTAVEEGVVADRTTNLQTLEAMAKYFRAAAEAEVISLQATVENRRRRLIEQDHLGKYIEKYMVYEIPHQWRVPIYSHNFFEVQQMPWMQGKELQGIHRHQELLRNIADATAQAKKTGRLVITIGAVRLEIEGTETKVYISSPKTQVTNVVLSSDAESVSGGRAASAETPSTDATGSHTGTGESTTEGQGDGSARARTIH